MVLLFVLFVLFALLVVILLVVLLLVVILLLMIINKLGGLIELVHNIVEHFGNKYEYAFVELIDTIGEGHNLDQNILQQFGIVILLADFENGRKYLNLR